jgi:recombination protein RecA
MRSAAVTELESLLLARKFDATLSRLLERDAAYPVAACGLPGLDALLGGGWRRGEVSEIVGARSSGRTSVLVAALAAATARGEVVGLVDAVDRFDPWSAAAAGVDLTRVLWVRGAGITVEMARPPVIDQAVRQAVRACDLIIRAGGFGLVVLDLADVPGRWVRALPHPTWLRLAHANEGRQSACLLVGESPMGRSARGTTLALEASGVWTGDSAQSRRFGGLAIRFTPRAAHQPVGTRDAGMSRQAPALRRG